MRTKPAPADTPLRRDAGLTLLELLVVVTILVLLTVAIGTVALNYLGRAKSDAAKLQISQIEAGLDLYRLDVGRYPSAQEGLGALLSRPAGEDKWRGPYLQKPEAINDPWGAQFLYRSPGTERAYDLVSLGADGAAGGEDENADISN